MAPTVEREDAVETAANVLSTADAEPLASVTAA
jgi:hypothetical protein